MALCRQPCRIEGHGLRRQQLPRPEPILFNNSPRIGARVEGKSCRSGSESDGLSAAAASTV